MPKLSEEERELILQRLVNLDDPFEPTPAMEKAIREGLRSTRREDLFRRRSAISDRRMDCAVISRFHQVRRVAVASKIVRASFFKRDPLTCARELIGTELIWGDCSGIVVEVEAYAAINDEAAHTFTRPSARSFIERNQRRRGLCLFQLWNALDAERAGERR